METAGEDNTKGTKITKRRSKGLGETTAAKGTKNIKKKERRSGGGGEMGLECVGLGEYSYVGGEARIGSLCFIRNGREPGDMAGV